MAVFSIDERFFAPVGDVVQLPRGGAFHLMSPASKQRNQASNATDKTITIRNNQKQSAKKQKRRERKEKHIIDLSNDESK